MEAKGEGGRCAYLHKSCVGEFEYKVTSSGGGKRSVKLKEKRVVTFNPSLAAKQRAEIARQVEKARGLRLAGAKRGEYGDSAKFVTFEPVDSNGEVRDARVVASLNRKAIDRAYELAGYNMLVTSETELADEEIYSTYHELWRIEETFKTMKSQLDARPVYLQKPDSIIGHFLICYISVLLERLVQLKVLNGGFCTGKVMEFARGFKVAALSERKYVNLSRSSDLLEEMEALTGLPLGCFYLSKGQIGKILDCELK